MLQLLGSLALHPAAYAQLHSLHSMPARSTTNQLGYGQQLPLLLQPAAMMQRVSFAPSMTTPSELTELGLNCVGCVAGPSGTVVVVGTAHTPCRSEAEVSEVIARLKPDAVILELDQERLDLLLEGQGGLGVGYGDEFAAAARAAAEAGVPVVLGDARIRDMRNELLRVWRPDAARLLRAARLAAPALTLESAAARAEAGEASGKRVLRVDVLRAFRDDPAKLKPLTGAAVWTLPAQ